MIVTVARKQEDLEQEALIIAQQLQLRYVKRRGLSIGQLCAREKVDEVLVLTNEGLQCVFKDRQSQPFFFHPSSAMFRVKRLMKGEHDPFIDATALTEGMSILDGTLGLSSDAIVASYVVGKRGRVVGVEKVPIIAYIVKEGLQRWDSEIESFNQAMRHIEVNTSNALSFLINCPDKSFDVVYFDPMFEQTVGESKHLNPLKQLASFEEINATLINEAKRVASKRIVLKDSHHSPRFEALGFQPIVRKHATHWYGVLEVGR